MKLMMKIKVQKKKADPEARSCCVIAIVMALF
jgi:hypothetical protein